MAALYRQHVKGEKRPQGNSKQGESKEDGSANKKQKCSILCKSIANALMTHDMEHVFLLEGDRHFWPGSTKAEWAEKFWPSDSSKDSGVPFQVYTVQDTLTFLGVVYDKETMTRHILTHMLSKGWVPKCCFPNPEGPHNVGSVPVEKLEELHRILRDFTGRVANHHYRELVMGAIDTGPTDDTDIILATMYKETEEEAGASKEDLEGKVEFLKWGDPYTSRRDGTTTRCAIYVTKFDTLDEMSRNEMSHIWDVANAKRRPLGFNGWRCPHAWYKKIPGIDMAAAAREKAIQETRNGKWYSVADAMALMDKKNKTMLEKILF